MPSSVHIRLASPADFDALAEVMFDAVRNGPSLYTPEQHEAWVPIVRNGPAWTERLAAQTILMAQRTDEIEGADDIAGFLSLATDGYIDLAFIRPSHRGIGLFRKLYVQLELMASERGERKLWVHASLTAQPAFTAVGFEILHAESVSIGDQKLRRFEMQKWL